MVLLLLLRLGQNVTRERLRRLKRQKDVTFRLVLLLILLLVRLLIKAVLMPLLFKIVNLKVEGREVVLWPEKPGWDAVKSTDLER